MYPKILLLFSVLAVTYNVIFYYSGSTNKDIRTEVPGPHYRSIAAV